MNEKGSILAEELEYAVGALERTVEGLGEEEYRFKPTPVSNSVQWQLNHISRIVSISLPRLIKGVTEYTPEGWPEDYRDQDYGMKKLMADIKKGMKADVDGLKGLSDEDLEIEIPLTGGTRQRKIGLFAYIGEVFHHRGQAAYVRGTYKRLHEK
ncbi:DinB family protein [Candidatus Bathyarchaeota archaeon]|nr:DinB family protein [Candidatus Bathyarchaeota archaeon]